MRTRVDVFVFVTIFLDLIGFGIVLPLLPIYVSDMGGNAETVGILFSCFSFTQLLATPWLGRLSDRFGRRPVILISLAGNAAAMVLFAAATRASMLPLLFISRILAGATSGNIAACQAAIADTYTGEERAQGMGRVGAAIGLGMVCGPIAGSALSHFGAWAPPLGSSVLAVLDLAGAFFLLPETRHLRAPSDGKPPEKLALLRAVTDRRISGVLALFFLLFLAFGALQVTLPLIAADRAGWGPVEVGRLFGVFGFISLVVQGGLLRPLVRRFGASRLVVLGPAIAAIGMACVVFIPGARGILVAIVPLAVGFGVAMPVLSTTASEYAPAGSEGGVLGLAQSAGGLARTIGPICAGTLEARVSHDAPFVAAAMFAASCALVGGVLLRANAPSSAPAS